jgi:hypothetical protein
MIVAHNGYDELRCKRSTVLIGLLRLFSILSVAAFVARQSVLMKIAHSVSLRMHTLQGQEAAINDQQGSARQQASQKLTLDEIKALQPGERLCGDGRRWRRDAVRACVRKKFELVPARALVNTNMVADVSLCTSLPLSHSSG